jgi:hypothetical protein
MGWERNVVAILVPIVSLADRWLDEATEIREAGGNSIDGRLRPFKLLSLMGIVAVNLSDSVGLQTLHEYQVSLSIYLEIEHSCRVLSRRSNGLVHGSSDIG